MTYPHIAHKDMGYFFPVFHAQKSSANGISSKEKHIYTPHKPHQKVMPPERTHEAALPKRQTVSVWEGISHVSENSWMLSHVVMWLRAMLRKNRARWCHHWVCCGFISSCGAPGQWCWRPRAFSHLSGVRQRYAIISSRVKSLWGQT